MRKTLVSILRGNNITFQVNRISYISCSTNNKKYQRVCSTNNVFIQIWCEISENVENVNGNAVLSKIQTHDWYKNKNSWKAYPVIIPMANILDIFRIIYHIKSVLATSPANPFKYISETRPCSTSADKIKFSSKINFAAILIYQSG